MEEAEAPKTKKRQRQKPSSQGTPRRVRRKVVPPTEAEETTSAEAEENSSAKAKNLGNVSYTNEVRDMMYTFGDARNCNEETVAMVESIVLNHILDLIRQATKHAHKRGVTRVTLNDLVYQIRKDVPKLNRLKDFLGWKEVRKNFGKSDDTQEKEKPEALLEVPRKRSTRDMNVAFDLLHKLRCIDSEEEEDSESEESSDEMDVFNKERLKIADEITKTMTREEYMEYTECRQASFTYKKNKKFRQWLGTVMNVQLNEDMVEVLGYLAWEMVGQVTRQAVQVKKQMAAATYRGSARGGSIINIKLQSHIHEKAGDKTPLLPLHIREAVRRLAPAHYHSLVDFTFTARGGKDK